MILLILGVLVILAGISLGLSAEEAGWRIGGLVGGLVLGIILIVASCFASIPTGHTGIVTTFGKVEDYTLDAGIHNKKPWQSVVNMDNRVQKANTTLACFSADIQEVQVIYTLNYQINKQTASTLYRNIGKDYYDTVITPNVAESVKVVMAKYTAEQLISNRAVLASEIEAILSENLKQYEIELVSTAIEDMDFTDAFTNAVEAKQVAAQNKLKVEIEQQQKTMEAEQTAERAKIEATAEAEVAKTKANAGAEVAKIAAAADLEVQKINADAAEYTGKKEASKNESLANSLTEELLRYFYIQQWSGNYPETYVESSDVTSLLTFGK